MVFLMETWVSVFAYPLNIAGRPLFSWPAFIIPAYEWTILWAGLSAAFGMLAMCGLPTLYHPLFNAANQTLPTFCPVACPFFLSPSKV